MSLSQILSHHDKNGKYPFLYNGTVYTSGESGATVGLSSCYSQGTLIETKMESVKGEVSWNANNEKIVN